LLNAGGSTLGLSATGGHGRASAGERYMHLNAYSLLGIKPSAVGQFRKSCPF
jgi:hypothetical protein